MVTQYGMSDELGLRVYGEKQELVFLGREISEQRDYSDAVAEQIDAEVRQIIDSEYRHAYDLLLSNRAQLDHISRKLLEVETLEASEFVALMDGKQLPSPKKMPGEPLNTTPPMRQAEAPERRPPSLDMPPSPRPA
jgi:cell division protease FtsH